MRNVAGDFQTPRNLVAPSTSTSLVVTIFRVEVKLRILSPDSTTSDVATLFKRFDAPVTASEQDVKGSEGPTEVHPPSEQRIVDQPSNPAPENAPIASVTVTPTFARAASSKATSNSAPACAASQRPAPRDPRWHWPPWQPLSFPTYNRWWSDHCNVAGRPGFVEPLTHLNARTRSMCALPDDETIRTPSRKQVLSAIGHVEQVDRMGCYFTDPVTGEKRRVPAPSIREFRSGKRRREEVIMDRRVWKRLRLMNVEEV